MWGMVCLACRSLSQRTVCERCRIRLAVGPERLLSFGIVRSGFVHDGPARAIVHRLKYDGIEAAGRFLAHDGMAHLVPPDARALVPIPRIRWRTMRYGIDPAAALAEWLATLTGVPVVAALIPAWFGGRHAGRDAAGRTAPVFERAAAVIRDGVLVDDVLTTGGTMESAAATLGSGVIAGVTATVSV